MWKPHFLYITPYSRDRYFPFPCPFTFSTSPLSTNSFNSSDALVDLKPVVLSTPVLPKTSLVPYFSNKISICPTVLSDIPGNISTRHLSISAFSAPMSVSSATKNLPLICIVRFRSSFFSPSNRFRKNSSKYSVVSWTPLVKSL